MVDYPSNDERILYFLDGCLATLIDTYEDPKSDEIYFMFKPTEKTIWKHNIPETDFDEMTGTIQKAYPRDLCFCVDHSVKFQSWILFCDFAGNQVNPADKLNAELLAKVKSLKNERDAWMKSAILGAKRMKNIAKHPESFRDTMLGSLAKQKKVMGSDLLGGNEDDKK